VNEPAGSDAVRLDVWLDGACLFKTRSEAKRACEGGKVTVNDDAAKPHRQIREGDRIRISRGFGRYQDVVVRIVLDQHVKKSEARVLFDDVTRKPTEAEIEMRRIERIHRAAAQAAGATDRRRRREIRRFKERS
jgi:ribosome-associated heat shock protein Hsp15